MLASRVRLGPVTILQLTKLVPWKRMDSVPDPLGRSLVTRTIPPWAPSALDGHAFKHVTSYPGRFCEYAFGWIFVSIMISTSNPPRVLPPVWPAPIQSPYRPGCLAPLWQAWVSVGAGGAVAVAPCVGGRYHGGSVGKS